MCNVDECSRLYASTGQAVPWERDTSGNVCCRRPGVSGCRQTEQEVQ